MKTETKNKSGHQPASLSHKTGARHTPLAGSKHGHESTVSEGKHKKLVLTQKAGAKANPASTKPTFNTRGRKAKRYA